ncbi:MAG: glycosyltransferase family 2 protein [Candidatus Hydrogenedentota bacterium]
MARDSDQDPKLQNLINDDIELSIIMPCLNEAETLETCILKAQNFLRKYEVSGEIIIGDNGSTDGSQAIAERCGARVVDVPTRGYGAALYYATRTARGRYGIMADSDDSYDFSNLMPFVEKLREGYDLVMGNRFAGGIAPGAMPWKNRYIGNPILSGLGRLFFRAPVRDFHCGLRGFTLVAFNEMNLATRGMEYASEMVVKAVLKDMKVTEVPTTLSPDGRTRPPHLSPWRDGWRHLRFLLLFSPRWLFLYPGLLLTLFCLVLGGWIWIEPRELGPFTLDIHTLLYAAIGVVIGFQAISFYLLSRIFASRQGLLPPSKGFEHTLVNVGLEWTVVAGFLVALAGMGGLLYAIAEWRSVGFGGLNPSDTMRVVIPAGLATILGLNLVLNGLFMGMLKLPLRMSEHD